MGPSFAWAKKSESQPSWGRSWHFNLHINGAFTLEFKDADITINAQNYCGTLQDLHTAIKKECPSMLTICHHVACSVQNIRYYMHLVLDHLTYSLDLPSRDFHASGSLEKVSKDCTFISDKDVIMAMVECFQKQLRKHFVGVIHWLVQECDACLGVHVPIFNGHYSFTKHNLWIGFIQKSLIHWHWSSLRVQLYTLLLNWEVWLLHSVLPRFFLYRCNNFKPCLFHRNSATKTNNITPTDNSKHSISRFI